MEEIVYDKDGCDIWEYSEGLKYPLNKYNPRCIYLWKSDECYVNFWNRYFEDFYNDLHPKEDDEMIFKLYQEFWKVVYGIKYNRYAFDGDSYDQYWKEVDEEIAEFERSCEPDTPGKYTKEKPSIVKYIGKHQLKALPDHVQKNFNQKVSTNKTVKAPSSKRRHNRGRKMKDIKIFL
jgi:hypothetical protein